MQVRGELRVKEHAITEGGRVLRVDTFTDSTPLTRFAHVIVCAPRPEKELGDNDKDDLTLTLPFSPPVGMQLIIKKINKNRKVRVVPASGGSIDDHSNLQISKGSTDAVMLVFIGAEWSVITW